jgi:hypothetical protein
MKHITIVYCLFFTGLLFAGQSKEMDRAAIIIEAIPISVNTRVRNCQAYIKYLVIESLRGKIKKEFINVCYKKKINLTNNNQFDVSLSQPYLLFLKKEDDKIQPYKYTKWQYKIDHLGNFKDLLNSEITSLLDKKIKFKTTNKNSEKPIQKPTERPIFTKM